MDAGPAGSGGGVPPAGGGSKPLNFVDVVLPKELQSMIFGMLDPQDRIRVEGIFKRLSEYNQDQMTPEKLKELYDIEHRKLPDLHERQDKINDDLKILHERLKVAYDANQEHLERTSTSASTEPSDEALNLFAVFQEVIGKEHELEKVNSELLDTREILTYTRKKISKKDMLSENKIAFDKIAELFGGHEKYSELPVLELRSLKLSSETLLRNYVDYIKPEHVTAPIMRGEDSLGHRFFVLRLQEKENTQFPKIAFCITIFEQMGTTWGTFARGFHSLNDILDFGKEQPGYAKLQVLLEGNDPTWEIK
jgi:hypothetical protein